MRRTRIFRLVALPALALLFVAAPAAAQDSPQLEAALTEARRLLKDAQAAEAKAALEKFIAASTAEPDRKEAQALIDRVKSIEILIDDSHEVSVDSDPLMVLLRAKGYGVTRCHAFLPSQRDELARYELIILRQTTTSVKYDELEYAALFDYVKGGGRLLFIADEDRWRTANRTPSLARYPLRDLAKRFRLFLRKRETEEKAIGDGKIFYYRDKDLLAEQAMRSGNAETEAKAVSLIEGFLPYPRLEASSLNRQIDPEIEVKIGRVKFRYAQTMETEAAWIIKALPTVARYYIEMFGVDLEDDVTLIGHAEMREYYKAGDPAVLAMATPKDVLLHQVAVQLYAAWMRPPGSSLRYPSWMAGPWADMAALTFLKRLGDTGRYGGFERHHAGMYRGFDGDGKRINVVSPDPKTDPYALMGKSEFFYNDLVRQFGPTLMPRFREMVVLYHRAGKIEKDLDSETAVKLLSLAAKTDLVRYFQEYGTKLKAIEVDQTEPARLRNALAEKTGPEPAKQ